MPTTSRSRKLHIRRDGARLLLSALLVTACTIGAAACGSGSDGSAPSGDQPDWASATPSADGEALAAELYAPKTLSLRTATADGINELTRQCMAKAGFAYDPFTLSETGGIYSPAPRFWEVDDRAASDPDAEGDRPDPMGDYLATLSAAKQKAFDEANESGPVIEVEALGTEIGMHSKGCLPTSTKEIVGDLATYARLDHIAGNLNAQAEQLVLSDESFIAAAKGFERCVDDAGVKDALFPIDVLEVDATTSEAAKSAAIRCSTESGYADAGADAFAEAQARFATFYAKDLRQYQTLLGTSSRRANAVLAAS